MASQPIRSLNLQFLGEHCGEVNISWLRSPRCSHWPTQKIFLATWRAYVMKSHYTTACPTSTHCYLALCCKFSLLPKYRGSARTWQYFRLFTPQEGVKFRFKPCTLPRLKTLRLEVIDGYVPETSARQANTTLSSRELKSCTEIYKIFNLFKVGFKLGLWPKGQNIDWWFMKIGPETNIWIKETKIQENGGN